MLNSLSGYNRFPAVWFSLVFAAGLLAGWAFRLSDCFYWLLLISMSLIAITVVFYIYYREKFSYLLIPLIFLCAMVSMQSRLNFFSADHLINMENIDQVTAFSGVISEAHYRIGKGDRYELDCDMIWKNSEAASVSGKILLSMTKEIPRLKPGACLQIAGKPIRPDLPANPGAFNYRHYLQLQGIFYVFRVRDRSQLEVGDGQQGYIVQRILLQPVRDYIRAAVDNHIQPPARDVIKALILGERQDLDRGVLEDFQRSGIIHVLAISGLHAGFILLIFMLVFSFLRFSYRNRVILALVCLWIFVALVNFKAPVIRASFMTTLYFVSRFGQRQAHPLNIMGVAALVILLWDPLQILMPGFQFSFIAVGGILYGYPRLSRWLAPSRWYSPPGRWLDKWIRQPFLVSLAAVISTAPLTWYHFGVLQAGALLINILIIPFIFAYIILIFVYFLINAIPLFPQDGLIWMLENSFNSMYGLIHCFSGLPLVQIKVGFPSAFIMFLSFIIVFMIYFRRWLYMLSILLIVYFLYAGFPFSEQRDPLQITFLSVGQGDGAIIRFPNNEVMVVDGGDRNFSFDAGKRYMLPALNHYNIRKIKYLVGSHGHSDHIGGLITILREVDVDTLVLSEYDYESKLYKSLKEEAKNREVAIAFRMKGDQLYPDSSCRIYIMHPNQEHQRGLSFSGHEVNNSSLALKIQYGKTGFLMTGDLEKEAEPCLLDYGLLLKADVLKAGHHGSITSSSRPFLKVVQPDFAVISVGRRNRFFHPSRKTVARLQDNGALVLRTDRLGAVVVESNGKKVKLINWRK